jgi:hypothetical protein
VGDHLCVLHIPDVFLHCLVQPEVLPLALRVGTLLRRNRFAWLNDW